MSALGDGGAVVVGTLRGTASFGPLTLSSAPNVTDAFVAKVAADGTWVWATAIGALGSTSGANGVRTLADGSAIVGGSFSEAATFGSTFLAGENGSTVVVAKVSADGGW